MQSVLRRVVSLGDELVELFVLLLGHRVRLLHPDGRNGVDKSAVERDVEANEIRVVLDDVYDVKICNDFTKQKETYRTNKKTQKKKHKRHEKILCILSTVFLTENSSASCRRAITIFVPRVTPLACVRV
jgi:hypothetical protein